MATSKRLIIINWLVILYFSPIRLACGVAHQALDAINPNGDDILIQGKIVIVMQRNNKSIILNDLF